MENMSYGERFRKLRMEHGISQKELAKALDVTPGYISNIEKGRITMSLRSIICLAEKINIPLDAILGSWNRTILRQHLIMNFYPSFQDFLPDKKRSY